MKLHLVMGLILVLVVVSACSKGNVLSGTSVVDVTEEQKQTTKSQESKTATNSKSDSATPSESAKTASGKDTGVSVTGTVGAEVVEADYSDLAGSCSKDSLGVVRVIDLDGTKSVYRPECLGGILVEYDCADNELDTIMNRCPGECVVENYIGHCA